MHTKHPTTKALMHSQLFKNKSYCYLKPTEMPALRFYGEPKIYNPGVRIRPIVSYRGNPLYNLQNT